MPPQPSPLRSRPRVASISAANVAIVASAPAAATAATGAVDSARAAATTVRRARAAAIHVRLAEIVRRVNRGPKASATKGRAAIARAPGAIWTSSAATSSRPALPASRGNRGNRVSRVPINRRASRAPISSRVNRGHRCRQARKANAVAAVIAAEDAIAARARARPQNTARTRQLRPRALPVRNPGSHRWSSNPWLRR